MRRSITAALVCALAGPPACGGGDMDVLVKLDSFACVQPTLTIASLDLFVAVEALEGGKPVLRSVPALRECIPASIPLTRDAVAKIFTSRGYVAKGVHADTHSAVVIHARVEKSCLGPMPFCLISEIIPPGGATDHVDLLSVCAPPQGTPPAAAPLWARCASLLAP